MRCIESVIDVSGEQEPGIIVVDNASEDDTAEFIRSRFPNVNLIVNRENLGYAAAVNIGVRASQADCVIVSNSDVEFFPGSISTLAGYFYKNEDIGCAGPQQVYPDGSWQYSYGDIPGFRVGFKELFFVGALKRGIRKLFWKKLPIDRYPKEVDYIDGAVMAIRREAFDDMQGFDEDYFFYTEEADFCYRLKKKGWYVLFQPKALVMHVRGGSTSTMDISEKNVRMFIDSKILFCRKHCSPFHKRFYILLEYIHTYLKKSAWKVIYAMNRKNPKALKKFKSFALLNKIWKEKMNAEKAG